MKHGFPRESGPDRQGTEPGAMGATDDPAYWQQRWRQGRTGWHRDDVMPLLLKHWASLDVAAGARVLVPLCGKSLDMPWLAAQGLRVLGVEVASQALDQFFAENHLEPRLHAQRDGDHYTVEVSGGSIEIILGDVFGVATETCLACDAVYDRAALIAFSPSARERYAREVYGPLPPGCRGLLITLEYPPGEMEGPPYSVDEPEVRRLFAPAWDVDLLERRDILADQPMFQEQGVSALSTAVYRLVRLQ
jgi:thiopurine S-methyltransferase